MNQKSEKTLEVLFTPADFAALKERDLKNATCVVFDVLRATSSMITALTNGAKEIIPVETIQEALAIRAKNPNVMLAGERDGYRIRAKQTGSIDFDLGNSPREFTAEAVKNHTIVMTTTNGTRALRACAGAAQVWVGSFLNLDAVVKAILSRKPANLIVVCSGTFEESAYEDVLGAGALCDLVWHEFESGRIVDSALAARKIYQLEAGNLRAAIGKGRNGVRLLSRSDLEADVAFCAKRDSVELCAELKDGTVKRSELTCPG